MITIQLNGERRIFIRPLTVRQLLEETQIASQAIAVAVNSEIVPRSQFESVKVCDRDQVEIIHAVGGG